MIPRSRFAARATRVVAIVALLGLMGAACAADDDVDGALPADETDEGPNLASKPELGAVLPDDRGDPPSRLRVEDLVVGEGDAATEGAELVVHFVGASWSSGQEFDATWERAQPYTFTLGEGEVIPAWDEGLIGMRVGGRRVLVVPPEMGYGDRGSAAGIGPGETIVFIVDLLEVDG
jgi:peptidylprolyl isomerase